MAKRKGSMYEPRAEQRVPEIDGSQEFVIGGDTTGKTFDALIVGCATTAGRLDSIRFAATYVSDDWVSV
jgi:hypothetical protein